MSRFLGTKGPWAECARLQTPRSPGVRNYAGAYRAFLFWELNMDADDRLNGEAVDLKPLVGLLHGLPSSIIERLTVDAIHEHRTLLEQAENLFNELPAEVKAGKQLWQISNTGQQIHHILITKLPEGVTVDDIIAWVNEEVPSGPPPFLNPDGSVTGSGYEALSPGQSAWTEIDLPVGQYTVFDLLPDMSAQPPVSHITEGMHQTLTVVAGD